MIVQGTTHYLSYKEANDIVENEEAKVEMIRNCQFEALSKLHTEMTTELDKMQAFAIETRLFDGINLVTKVTEIPVTQYVQQVRMNNDKIEPHWMTSNKLKLFDRIKVLVKGRL